MPMRLIRGTVGVALRGAILAALALPLAGCEVSTRQPPSELGKPLRSETADAVRDVLRHCWMIDPDAPSMAVSLDVSMRSDGTVAEAVVADTDQYSTDQHYRDLADRALSAVMNPNCQPLPFPREDWPSWQSLTLVFDPGDFVREDQPPGN